MLQAWRRRAQSARHPGDKPARSPRPRDALNIIILDDYQDAVRKLKCAGVMEALNAKVFTNTVKGIGQLSVRLRDADVLVLIRERTHFPKQLLEKLPRLKLLSQTGKVGLTSMSTAARRWASPLPRASARRWRRRS